jgi:hypothetical protein
MERVKIRERKKDWEQVAHTYNPSYSGGRDQEAHGSKPAWEIVQELLSRKYPTQKRASRVAQVMERLPSKCKTLNSSPCTTQKGEKKKTTTEHMKSC